MSVSIRNTRINGYLCRFYSSERPSLPTVVLLAGAFQSIETLDSLIGIFKKYNVVVVELPGQGGAGLLEAHYSCNFIAKCLDIFINRHISENYFLFAYSYANLIAIEYLKICARSPEKTILAGAMAQLTDDQSALIYGLMQLSPKDCVEAFADFVMNPKLESKKHNLLKRASVRSSLKYMKQYPTHFRHNTQRLLNYDIGSLDAIDSSCMTLGGELDPFVTPELSFDLARRIKGCGYEIIDKSDHLFYLEQPEKTRKVVEKYFQ